MDSTRASPWRTAPHKIEIEPSWRSANEEAGKVYPQTNDTKKTHADHQSVCKHTSIRQKKHALVPGLLAHFVLAGPLLKCFGLNKTEPAALTAPMAVDTSKVVLSSHGNTTHLYNRAPGWRFRQAGTPQNKALTSLIAELDVVSCGGTRRARITIHSHSDALDAHFHKNVVSLRLCTCARQHGSQLHDASSPHPSQVPQASAKTMIRECAARRTNLDWNVMKRVPVLL